MSTSDTAAAGTTVPGAAETSADAAAPRPVRDGEMLLEVDNLGKHFPVTAGLLRRQVAAVKAVDGVSFSVRKGETLGLVGESGCGKSTTGRMIMRLLDPSFGKITFEGEDITRMSQGRLRPLRRDLQMIFQDPYSSLNPRKTVGAIVGAPFRLQNIATENGVKKAVQEILELVGLNPEHYNRYPHEFSGGQRQRIGIARTLALKPKLIVADEPVSALDVSVQAQVVNLLEDLQDELDLTYVVIAHDLSVVRHISDRVAVMYLGKIVEIADRNDLYERPMHPYTNALLSAVPVPDPSERGNRQRIRLQGDVPSPLDPPPACRFHTRCWKAQDICKQVEPPLIELSHGHQAACHFPENTTVSATDEVAKAAVAPGAAPAGETDAETGE
ncbi:ABC transporter ATP-binding protein [Actinomadura montaniterrae]|uniref:ABC transporter ATP-binding protein n=2 Tax=Actinomadura montaniterrae TaxID=1803903 RepID=A0A6L3VS01_9ACTN|nr:ABC transporter ATP-binding protein [Actinomadura montaniterrae]